MTEEQVRPLFRQSLAKLMLQECPALVKKQLDESRNLDGHAVRRGSIHDALVFGHTHKYEVVEAFYKSGPRKGEPCIDWQGADARKEKERIEATGKIAVLQTELDDLEAEAGLVRARIESQAKVLADGHPHKLMFQPQLRWRSELGVDCRGEPDVVLYVSAEWARMLFTFDVKRTAGVREEQLHRQVYSMGWDIQGAAYKEGTVAAELQFDPNDKRPIYHGGHFLLCTMSMHSGLPPVMRPLSASYMAVGKTRWEKAQRKWLECVATGVWPGYAETPIEPNQYVIRTEMEAYSEEEFEEEP